MKTLPKKTFVIKDGSGQMIEEGYDERSNFESLHNILLSKQEKIQFKLDELTLFFK